MPKVSFVVAAYNVASYIEQCVRSLFEQTLRDIEIIIVDDCTPDNSVELVQNLLESYPNRKSQVRFVHYESNRGLPQARRAGVSEATGEYVQFIDGDDWVEVTMAEEQYGKAVESDADVVMFDFFKESVGSQVIESLAPNGVIGNGENLRDDVLNRISYPSIWARMFRRTLFSTPGLIWPTYSMAEDVVATGALMFFAKKIAYEPRPFYHYRYNPSSVTNAVDKSSIVNRFNGYCQNSIILNNFLEQQGVAEKYSRGILLNKVMARNQISLLLGESKYRKLWKSTFPELNHIMFWGNSQYPSSFKNKLWYIAVVLGLYPRFRFILLSRYLRPSPLWYSCFPRIIK